MFNVSKIVAVLLFLIPLAVSAQGTNTVTSTVTSANTVTGTTTVDKTPPSAHSPSIVVNNQDVCTRAASGSVTTQILGISTGIVITDDNCERLKLSRALFGMGMKVAAVALLCQDERVFGAMEMAGTPCPYYGKIGTEAAEAWANNPEQRPDYEKWKKRNGVGVDPKKPDIDKIQIDEEQWKAQADEGDMTSEEKTLLGGGIAILLLFLL